MYGDERLRKLDRAYSIFNIFQLGTLTVGILSAIFALVAESDVWDLVFVLAIMGGTVAFILFGIITMNMTDRTMMDRYPDVRPRKSFSVSKFGFRYSEDLNGPMIQKARKTHDQLAEDVYRKTGRTWMLAAINAIVPVIVLYLVGGLLRQ